MSNIWLTRPQQQAGSLVLALSGLGHQVLHLPMLAIKPLPWDASVKARILDFDLYDLAIFISSNAAKTGLACLDNFWPQYPAHIKYFALGPTTAKVLQQHDLNVIYPPQAMSSEAVLELEALSAEKLTNKKVLIFRGQGGRELLAESLRERGAKVDYVELYQRNAPIYTDEDLDQYLLEQTPDALIVSSAEALNNFVTLFKETYTDMLNLKLFVSSERLKTLADNFGFTDIVKMPGADDNAIIKSISAIY